MINSTVEFYRPTKIMSTLPKVKVINVSKNLISVKTEAQILDHRDYFIHPNAPGSINIYTEGEITFSFPVHKLLEKKLDHLVFETYETDSELPEVNNIYTFQSWFTYKQLDLIENKNYRWTKKRIPSDYSIEYCELTYENFEPGMIAYTNGNAWISDEAYTTYIKNDLLRLRN